MGESLEHSPWVGNPTVITVMDAAHGPHSHSSCGLGGRPVSAEALSGHDVCRGMGCLGGRELAWVSPRFVLLVKKSSKSSNFNPLDLSLCFPFTIRVRWL